MKRSRLRTWAMVFLAALLMLLGLPTTAFAYETIDTVRETSLAVSFAKDGVGFSGVEFRLYRVAEVSSTVRFTLTESFSGYPVSLDDLDSSGWRALAQTLDGYVARDALEPLRTASTDSQGRALFDHLPTGLYLVTGEPYREDGVAYTPEPFLLNLPNRNAQTDRWEYDAVAACKYESGGDAQSRKVLKIWDDNGHREQRPESIVVQLLRNGEIYDTVTLSAANNWRHTWTGLDEDAQWRVVERDTPKGYTVSVEREGIAFVMTNAYAPGEPTQPGDSKLPQTGMLWWPVPLLVLGGLILFLLGLEKRRHGEA